MITNTQGSFPQVLQGTIVFSGSPTAFVPGEVVTGSGFTAVAVKYVAATKTLTVKKIAGNPTGALTGSIAGAGTVATINSVTVAGLGAHTGGWNLRETNNGIVRSKIAGSRTLVEVMLASANLITTRADFGTPATFTLTGGVWGGDTARTYDISAGDAITFTILSTEPTKLPSGTTYAFTITDGSNVLISTRAGTLYSTSSDGLTHTFRYVPVAADAVVAGKLKIAAVNFGLNGGTAYEVAANGSQKALTAPVAVAGSLADATGITIQA
jgi:hypothetical protein